MNITINKERGLTPLLVLVVLLVLLGVGGFVGGFPMLIDPTGTPLGLSPDMLAGLPIEGFFWPGLFLIGVMGVVPFVIAWGLWQRSTWAWTATVGQSLVLILWICLQLVLWGRPVAIQVVYLIWGIVMLTLAYWPGVRGSVAS